MHYPALDITGADAGLALAEIDDFAPTAVDEREDGVSIFFATAAQRAAAAEALRRAFPSASVIPREVDDEDWARRSQENLTPVTVGRITVTPPWCRPEVEGDLPPDGIVITITPSMGFGTGHHPTTRLCLAALQDTALESRTLLDIGTGSGVLAIAGARLGAREALGIDVDSDAVTAALENLAANPDVSGVRFEVQDLRQQVLPPADVVVANLTGAMLEQVAGLLIGVTAPGGRLIASGVQSHERDAVVAALAPARLVWSAEESGWLGLAFNVPGVQTV